MRRDINPTDKPDSDQQTNLMEVGNQLFEASFHNKVYGTMVNSLSRSD